MLAETARVLRTREAEKEYLAVVYGPVPFPKGRIDRRILRDPRDPRRRTISRTEGKDATTLWERLAESQDGEIALLRCRLLTGRTHQIRVHLAHAGHPVLGDDKYGDFAINHGLAKRGVRRLFLHACRLSLRDPLEKNQILLQSPLPADMQTFLEAQLALPADRL